MAVGTVSPALSMSYAPNRIAGGGGMTALASTLTASSPNPTSGTVQAQSVGTFGALELGKLGNSVFQAWHWRKATTSAVQTMWHSVFHPGQFFSAFKSLMSTAFHASLISGAVDGIFSALYNGWNVMKGQETAGKAVREVAFDAAAGVGGGLGATIVGGIGGALLSMLFGGPLLALGTFAFGLGGYMLGSNTVKAGLYSIWDHFATKMNLPGADPSNAPTGFFAKLFGHWTSGPAAASAAAAAAPPPTLYTGPSGTPAKTGP